jgi:dihydrolipoamide dehydrogenase
MSKKIAEGTSALVLDVKTGSGAFMSDPKKASELARTMVQLGKDAGVNTRALVTAMDVPLGLTAGNALEVRESVEVLAGGGPADVIELTVLLAREMIDAAGIVGKDPEVAAVLEDTFLARGVRLFKGARATTIERTENGVRVVCDDGRVSETTHAVLAIGSLPNTEGLGLENVGVETDGGYIVINRHCQSSIENIYAAGDVSGKLPLSSVASMQGRKVAEQVVGGPKGPHRHLDYDKAASAIFTEPEIADVGLAEAEAFASGRKIRVTKVPFSSTAKALINNDSRGFVKIISDPATGEVLGGSIVGRHAAELISVIALAVTANLKVTDIEESLLVHPALAEALSEAAD